MEYTDDSGLEYIGFDVDLAKELASMFGLEVEFVNTTFDGVFAGLDKGQYDMIIAAVSITPERQAAYEMTEPLRFEPAWSSSQRNKPFKTHSETLRAGSLTLIWRK